MMRSSSASVDDDEINGAGAGAATDADSLVLVWHTSGQQGMILRTSAGAGQLLGEGGVLTAAAMEGGDEGICVGAGDVLAQGQGSKEGVLVVRRREESGLQLLRYVWTGGYKGIAVDVCGEWIGSEDNNSAFCTVVLAFLADIAPTPPSPPLSTSIDAVRYACGYSDGTYWVICIVRHTSHVTGSVMLYQLDGSCVTTSLKADDQESCSISGVAHSHLC